MYATRVDRRIIGVEDHESGVGFLKNVSVSFFRKKNFFIRFDRRVIDPGRKIRFGTARYRIFPYISWKQDSKSDWTGWNPCGFDNNQTENWRIPTWTSVTFQRTITSRKLPKLSQSDKITQHTYRARTEHMISYYQNPQNDAVRIHSTNSEEKIDVKLARTNEMLAKNFFTKYVRSMKTTRIDSKFNSASNGGTFIHRTNFQKILFGL